jgi:hypothetical protein
MGLFNSILEKLGLKKDNKPAATTTSAPTTPTKSVNDMKFTPAASAAGMATSAATKRDDEVPAKAAMSVVDVVSHLDTLAKGKDLNWKVSIVDLLKLLDLDSSKEARIDLAKELNCPAELIGGDYSKMNVWLHKTVLQKIADNGGNIPADLLK